MRNPYQFLREKERELERVKRGVEAYYFGRYDERLAMLDLLNRSRGPGMVNDTRKVA